MGIARKFSGAVLWFGLLCAGILGACSPALAPAAVVSPTPSLEPTASLQPGETATSLQPAAAPAPTADIGASSDTIGLSLPIGDPLETWNTIPIMPDALTGEESDGTYAFTTTSTEPDIRKFYDETLVSLGWTALAEGTGETGLILFYQLGDQVISFLIVSDVVEGIQMVLIIEP
jgi:hypothetical protein